MLPNTNKKDWQEFYPVRKVNKVDIHTIDSIAKELQDGILKDSIENYFNNIR